MTQAHQLSQPSKSSQVAIIDQSIKDYQTLVASATAQGLEVKLITPQRDGFEQLAETLTGRSDIDALHIICHGRPGQLLLGETGIDTDDLIHHADSLRQIASTLADNADCLIYACELGQGVEGAVFLNTLQDYIGCSVAAASHKVGHADLGGAWALDMTLGAVQTPMIKSTEWRGVLVGAPTLLTAESTPADGGTMSDGSANIVLKFSEAMTFPSDFSIKPFTIFLYKGGQQLYWFLPKHNDDLNLEVYDPNEDMSEFLDGGYIDSTDQSLMVLNPPANLEPGEYYIRIDNQDAPNALVGQTSGLALADINITDPNPFNFTVGTANDAPTITGAPTDVTVTEDTLSDIDLSAIEFADTDGDQLTVTITASDGTFAAPADGANIGSGVTESLNDGSGSNVITLVGSAADINTYLDTASNIQYTGAENASGDNAATITIAADDGNGGNLASNPTVNIDITEVNDAPTLTATASNPTFTEEGSSASLFSAAAADSIETGQTFTELTLTVTNVSDTTESLTLDGSTVNLTNGATGNTETNNLSYNVSISEGTATVSLTNGSLTAEQLQTLINAIAYSNSDQNPTTDQNRVVTITQLKDNGGTENEGVDTASLSLASTVTVEAVNDAPVLDANESPAFSDLLENAAAPVNGSTSKAVLVSDLLTGASDADGNSLGMAITGVNENGSLYYTTDGGATWTELTASVSETSALVLAGDANSYLYFQPNADYSGELNDAISFKAWDGTDGSTAGQLVNTQGGAFEAKDFSEDSQALFVETLGNFAYISVEYNGGAIVGYDVSNPNLFQFDGFEILGGAGLAIANNLAYVTSGTKLSVVDINRKIDGNAYFPLGDSLDLGFTASSLVIGDVESMPADPTGDPNAQNEIITKAFVVDPTGKKVTAIQVTSDKDNPVTMTTTGAVNYTVSGTPNHADLSATHLFVADGNGIAVFVTTPSGFEVSPLQTFTTTGIAHAVKVVGNYAYVADGAEGLKILNIADLDNISEVGSVDTNGTAVMLKVVENTVYLADADAGVQIIDVSDPTNPTISHTIDTTGSVKDVAFANGTLFVADYGNAFLSYTQGENTAFSSDSDMVSLTVFENSLPTGEVQVEGTVQQGQTLTASNTLADEDGLGDISYQWLRDGQPIADAMGETYALTSADVGAEISVSASYTDGQGTDEIVTSAATSIVSALPTPPPPVPTEAPTPEPTEPPTEAPTEAPTPEPTVDTVDGVTVETQEESDENGNQTTTINVAPTTDERDEDEETEHGNLADIPIASDEQGNPVVQVSIPTGVGFTAQAVTPATNENGDLATTLRELLISVSEPRTESEEDLNEIIQEGIDAYVPTVNDEAQVTVRTVTLSTAEGRDGPVPSEPIIVTGAMGTGEDDLDNPDRQEALVIDVRDLPSGTVLQLDNVEFAIVIGATSINGGEGRNIVSGDGSSQFIVLGEADDILKGGAGNDTIGSRGGDDELYGGSGDDILFGGTDDDLIDGGVGTDIAVFAYDYAEYSITQLENTEDGTPQWQVSHATEGTDTLVNIEYLEFADVTITLTGESQINDFATSGLLFF
ncbi:DUF4347 domain-containing protein [Thiomicrorhabdus indica]|uniref:DUF4347 domain-containing protein n=1 Tax=Thiomicrorhabdus indica TaxID=2267253 RepID=UPI00102DB347|nr:DUF4347 domain-containing protein [Thiomicrorhabdus indica]